MHDIISEYLKSGATEFIKIMQKMMQIYIKLS